jgi:hypothetical protein
LGLLTGKELHLIIKNGTHLIQKYVQENLPPVDWALLMDDSHAPGSVPPAGYCFMLKNLKCDNECRVKNTINVVGKSKYDIKDLWIGDSGASCHFTNDDTRMYQWKTINKLIGVSDGNVVRATKQGNVRLKVIQKLGYTLVIHLHGCKYIPELHHSLFSITTALSRDWAISNKGIHIIFWNSHGQIIFDTVDPTSDGCLMMARMVPIAPTDHLF